MVMGVWLVCTHQAYGVFVTQELSAKCCAKSLGAVNFNQYLGGCRAAPDGLAGRHVIGDGCAWHGAR